MASTARGMWTAIRSMSTKRLRKPNRNPLMKIVLLENIPSLGEKGAVTEVKRGYGRNFLIPQGKALYLNRDTRAFVNPEAKSAAEMQALVPDEVAKMAKIERHINKKLVELHRNKSKTFEVTPDAISVACKHQLWLEVPKERIEIVNPITKHGLHYANIHLAPDRVASLQIDVMPV
ncbi:hypothetical protein PTSG_07103 [Salpingoeca rosetta]|uniref:50S ribosomal protein L9, chloroplastic n=1 Tax=Salpingoeca rosetta (strain ATCC 50818 / BSB-021) TaxID=946362 RepID=F2UE25_SALR5|nr:uncharacterized protein PTSG_07103 [Salpingoeca rosetta]EGD74875.1 hypothetical protein PTSG_07103 [Salpingoeca rosetta]|eukprot:XP_004992520.1 hypothetical protein PTSG_07103 [Salpingoeca rosetta]